MKKYASRKSHHGRTAFRTPSLFRIRKKLETERLKAKAKKNR